MSSTPAPAITPQAALKQYPVVVVTPVAWGDMDAFGHVNNAKYFTYCESARIRYFEELGIDMRREGEDPKGPAVVSATCNFRRQVHHPASLEVGARITHIGRTSFTIEYLIVRLDDGEIVADGTSIAVWVDYSEGKAIPVPEGLREKIRKIDPDA